MKFEDYWDRIFVINLKRRPDRLAHFKGEMAKIDVLMAGVDIFNAFDRPCEAHCYPNGDESKFSKQVFNWGVRGCASSHQSVLSLIAHNRWERVLVFEDDVEVIDPKNFSALWGHLEARLPGWDMLYLGGHWGSPPQARVNPNVLKVDTMLTTSSYGITWRMARRMIPFFDGREADALFSSFCAANEVYCIQPRLFCQYTNVSDIQDREMDNSKCMKDRYHESLLPYNYVGKFSDYRFPAPHVSAGKVVNPIQAP